MPSSSSLVPVEEVDPESESWALLSDSDSEDSESSSRPRCLFFAKLLGARERLRCPSAVSLSPSSARLAAGGGRLAGN